MWTLFKPTFPANFTSCFLFFIMYVRTNLGFRLCGLVVLLRFSTPFHILQYPFLCFGYIGVHLFGYSLLVGLVNLLFYSLSYLLDSYSLILDTIADCPIPLPYGLRSLPLCILLYTSSSGILCTLYTGYILFLILIPYPYSYWTDFYLP